jgi:N-acetylglucosaminyldiphosphoundecaprenol N-acetyl-beta-D-mannosaminyltransferase
VWGTGEQIDRAGKSLTWQGAMLEGNPAGKRGGDRRYILGVGINQVSVTQAVEIIDSCIQSRTQKYVCVTGVHGVMECQRHGSLMKIHNNSGLTVPDGMLLVWISRMRGHKNVTRVHRPDLTLSVCEFGQSRGYRLYFYGGKQRVPEELA